MVSSRRPVVRATWGRLESCEILPFFQGCSGLCLVPKRPFTPAPGAHRAMSNTDTPIPLVFGDYALEDRYRLDKGRVYLTGIQALVRLPMMQRQRDLKA